MQICLRRCESPHSNTDALRDVTHPHRSASQDGDHTPVPGKENPRSVSAGTQHARHSSTVSTATNPGTPQLDDYRHRMAFDAQAFAGIGAGLSTSCTSSRSGIDYLTSSSLSGPTEPSTSSSPPKPVASRHIVPNTHHCLNGTQHMALLGHSSNLPLREIPRYMPQFDSGPRDPHSLAPEDQDTGTDYELSVTLPSRKKMH